MYQVILDESLPSDAAVPPPPPPIYAERPRATKSGPGLTLTVKLLRTTAKHYAEQRGGTLWLRDATGWCTYRIPQAAFETAQGTGELSLQVEPFIDPSEALLQPSSEGWAQRVDFDFGLAYALVSAPAMLSP